MDVTTSTSLTIKEKLEQTELPFLLNYELRESGLYLSTYVGKVIPDLDSIQGLNDKYRSTVELVFHAEGKYVLSFREGINLLEGRFVLKSYVSMDGVSSEGWFKPDLDGITKDFQLYFSGGQSIMPHYDLEGVLKELPIAIDAGQKAELIGSLRSGDLQAIKLDKSVKDVSCYIEAAPETKSVSIYGDKMKPMKINQLVNDVEKIKQNKTRGKASQLVGRLKGWIWLDYLPAIFEVKWCQKEAETFD